MARHDLRQKLGRLPRSRGRLWLIFGVALAVRLALVLGWDSGLLSPHPDERQVAFVAERLSSWFGDPQFYAYGSLHFQVVRLFTTVAGLPLSYGGLLLGGRLLSLCASMLGLLLAWRLALGAWGRRTAELVLFLGALLPLDLQLSHFATVEAHHSLWVMVCLCAAWALARRPRLVTALVTGAAAGASLAVKVSSLPLAAPLTLCFLVLLRRDGWRRTAGLAIAAAAATVGLFFLCQPSAWAAAWPPLSPAYLRGVAEQITMVSGMADVPYVRVYHGTLPLLYSARELALWGLGPGLFVAALWGLGRATLVLLRRAGWRPLAQWNDSLLLLGLLCAWILPMALRLSTLEVKFLRYWQPLALPLAMLAAWWLLRLPRAWRRVVLPTVLALHAVAGVSYLWAFIEPHPHRSAAEWLHPLLEADQVVAVEHWDETLRLSTPEGGPRIATLASYDLPDDSAKLERWCTELAGADWVVLSSHRIRRTIFANRERYPYTARLYELLLAGELGFEPISQARRGPRLFGLRWPVQWADESFVNYEFPRVVILRRTASVPVEEMLGAALTEPELAAAPSLAQLERRFLNPVPLLGSPPEGGRQLAALGLWTLVLMLGGAALWVVLAPLLAGWPDAGVGLSLVSGWMLPAWLLWLGSEGSVWPVSATSASLLFLLVIGLGSVVAWRRKTMLVSLLWRRRQGIGLVLGCALAVAVLFLLVRLFNPAIGWGEKPMDFSFLNAFVAAGQWPPGEPWMAGKALNYYYFAFVLTAFPILVSGCHAAVGYNLMAATVPGLAAASLASLGLALARRRRAAGLLLPGLVLLSGNLAWPFLLDLARQGRWFDLWWATSRVVPGFAIDEYPLWTALFADLHSHFVALPVLVAALLWAWITVVHEGRSWWVPALGTGLSAAVLAATNPWDLLLYSLTLATAVVAAAAHPVRAFVRLAVAAVFSALAAAPFLVELSAWMAGSHGGATIFANSSGFAPAWAVARHFGLFLIPLGALALYRSGRDLMVALPLAGLGIWLGLELQSGAAALALALLVLFFAAATRRTQSRLERLQWALASLAMLAVALCERVTIMDRMNTIFKIYNGVWLLLAGALAVALLRQRGRPRRVLLICWLPLQLVALANLPLGVAQGWVQPRVVSPRPTLDGQAYLAQSQPQTWFLVRALEGAARPTDVVAEAAGDPYREFTRVAMHTGLPTVVGWEHHLFQRGQTREEIHRRFDDLVTLYLPGDPWRRRGVLDRYGVRWVVVDSVERRAYRVPGEADLEQIPGVLRFAAAHGAALYMVLPPGGG